LGVAFKRTWTGWACRTAGTARTFWNAGNSRDSWFTWAYRFAGTNWHSRYSRNSWFTWAYRFAGANWYPWN
jgi:hypothetical protein